MRAVGILLSGTIAAAAAGWAGEGAVALADPPAGKAAAATTTTAFPKFKTQEIDAGLSIGYAVLIADINDDRKPDIVVVDQHKVVWYENPTWKKRVILDGKTTPDNVCAAAADVDGDGKLDLVLGAAWKPFDTVKPGTLQWLRRGASLDDEWTLHPIPCKEPTVHRVRVADIDGDGRPEIILAPMMGLGATQKANWLDGRPTRILSYKVPKDPTKPEEWKPEVIADNLHVVHNVWVTAGGNLGGKTATSVLTASYEGVTEFFRPSQDQKWSATPLGTGDQSNPKSNRGASEVKRGVLRLPGPGGSGPDVTMTGRSCIGTIEPWHGNKVVAYAPDLQKPEVWQRHVIDDQLRWGHAVWFADLDGDKVDELIVGVRDDPNPKLGDKHTDRRGVRIYKNTDGKGVKWDRFILEDGGVAVEDLTAADLDGDGKPDIVACGRATKNVRIYWNQGK